MRKLNRSIAVIQEMVDASKRVASEFWTDAAEEVPSCRVCGCSERRFFLKVHDRYDYVECKNCGMLYLLNIPHRTKDMYADNGAVANGEVYVDDSIWLEREWK